jgi:hypothetical protein
MPSATTPTTWAPHRDGWYLQRDTTSYAYSAGGSFEHPRPAGAERLATLLTQAKRYRDM